MTLYGDVFTVDGPDRISQTSYNETDQPVGVVTALGTPAQRTYQTMTYGGANTNGQVLTLSDGKGNRSSYVYDGFDRVSQLHYPHPTVTGSSNAADYEQTVYDPVGRVASVRRRGGAVIAFGYDLLNRVTLKDLPGTSAEDVYYGYDNLGQLLSQRLGSTSGAGIVRGYDALGRVTSNAVMGRTLGYQYDLAGRRTRLSWPDGVFVDYSYDVSGAPKSVLDQTGATLATVTYDDLGRATGLGRGNGAATGFGYDGMSRLTGLTQSFTGTTANNNTTTFTRNPASQACPSEGWGHYPHPEQ
jgi:YD repeat-containing protein